MSFASIPSNDVNVTDLNGCPVAYGRASVLYDDHIYIHGGQINNENKSNDLYKINIETGIVEKLNITGYNPKVDSHKACLVDKKIIFSMGGDGTNWHDDIRELDLNSLVMQKIIIDTSIKPEPRAGHFMVYHKNKIYIGFGWSGQKALNDIWYLDLYTKHWHKIETNLHISPRDSASANILGDNIYICGGGVHRNFSHEIIVIDTNTNDIHIDKLCKDHPSAKPGCSSATDSQKIYILGGNQNSQNNNFLLTVYNPELNRFCYHKNNIFSKIGYGSNMHITDNTLVVIQGVYSWEKQSKMRNAKIIKMKFRDSKHEYNQKKRCYDYAMANIKTDININIQ